MVSGDPERSEDVPGEDSLEENEGFLDEELVPYVLALGVVLFLFPEPVTSTLGVVLVAVGIALWLVDLVS